MDTDDMAAPHDTEISDMLIPCNQLVRRSRPSDPWFDGDCRATRRLACQFERACAAAC
jgi:hypothetical protein